MFDILGIIAFLAMIYCVIMLVVSIFSRKVNTKVWGLVCCLSVVLFFVSYTLEENFGNKEEDIEIDYSQVVIETPTPEPTPEPTPTPSPEATATPIIIPTPQPTEKPTPPTTKRPVQTPTPTPTPAPTPTPTPPLQYVPKPNDQEGTVHTAPTPTPRAEENNEDI